MRVHRIAHAALVSICLAPSFALGAPCGPVAAFVEMVPKSRHVDDFFNGYRRDIEWHKSINDPWTWLGWVVANGDRRGAFIDAAVCLEWDSVWTVDRAENDRLNRIHYLNYVERSTSFHRTVEVIHGEGGAWTTQPWLQVVTIRFDARSVPFLDAHRKAIIEAIKKTEGFGTVVAMSGVLGESPLELRIASGSSSLAESAQSSFAFESAMRTIPRRTAEAIESIEHESWRLDVSLSHYPDRHMKSGSVAPLPNE